MQLPSFRAGFIGGLLAAIVLGVYLFQLWQPERQVELHSLNVIRALEKHAALEDFIASDYVDQWQQDRTMVLARLRQVLAFTPKLKISALGAAATAQDREGNWSARITIEAEPNEWTTLLKERVNTLDQPFELRWRKQSRKPWDWKLVRVNNPALELTRGSPF